MSDRTLGFQYATPAQQREASTLGMWTFLATEVLFLGTLVAAYLNYRIYHPHEIIEAARHTKIVLGTANTGVLLTSSACMAMAVRSVDDQARRSAVWWLLATALLGILFVAIKGYEYFEEFQEHLVPALNFDFTRYGPVGELFFTWYFAVTGFHAVHLVIGIVIVLIAAGLLAADRFPDTMSVRIIGLYWHFVDIVWIFLFPLIYLAGRAH
ncbi:MAG TPA: cytochrome c oxidase subunit 3 [Sphingomicrobium sp.]|jgi:cytochrome c oxidase subunit 3|nr:cytochrome c oxidase subunit 3 [Sphingomicrobium sp.]